jgi:hypothetical protein
MKRIFTQIVFFFLLTHFAYAQYSETFSVADKGILAGTCTTNDPTTCASNDFAEVNWTIEGNLSGFAISDDYFKTINGKLEAKDVDEETCWLSPVLTITGTASFSMDLTWLAFDNYTSPPQVIGSQDYIDVSYRIDGGSWVTLANAVGGGPRTISYATTPAASNVDGSISGLGASGLTGSTLQIRVCVDVNAGTEIVTIDNISATNATTGAAAPVCDLNLAGFSKTNEDCPGANDGSITVNATTSNGPIIFTLTGPVNQSNQTGIFTNLPPGNYEVALQDGSFTTGTCTENTGNINIAAGMDNTPPNVTCKNINADLDVNGLVTITPGDVFLSGSDNCGTVNLVSVIPDMFDCDDIGIQTVMLTVNDGNGNTATCQAEVNVRDVTPPVFECQDITVSLNASGTFTITSANYVIDNILTNFVDNCASGPSTFGISNNSWDCSNIGPNAVTIAAKDGNGNETPYTITITITDDLNVCCPTYTDNIAYVNLNATGANNGTSWTDAFTDLQDALNSTCPGITEIWVAAGTYYPTQVTTGRTATFQLKNGVAIYGGFNGTETLLTERNWTTNITILSGDINQSGNPTGNSYTIVTGSGTDATAVIDGFTITGGNSDVGTTFPESDYTGGGMYNNSGSPTVANCIFSGNMAIGYGGGMINLWGSSPTITNCTFSGNAANRDGGGMFNFDNSSPTVTNCTFSENYVNFYGGGMCNSSSSPTITNSTFSLNEAFEGGSGMYNGNSSPTVTNSIFLNNAQDGMYNEAGSSPVVTNCVFSGSGFYGISNLSSSPTVTNSIIWGNTSGGIFDDSSTPIVNYSIVQGGYTGTNNLNTDPLFVNAAGGDFSLTNASPAINAGDPSTNLSLFPGGPGNPEDLDGNPRVVGADIDMGAYENQVICPSGNVLYVNTNASGANDGTSWTDAFTDLQDALNSACPGISEIWVAAGTYYPTSGTDRTIFFVMKNGVAIYGGFVGTETQVFERDWVTNETILSGDIGTTGDFNDNSHRIIDNNNNGLDNSARIDGFTITGSTGLPSGNDNGGGGMRNKSSSPTVANCIFRDNAAFFGGGLLNENSAALIMNCVFINNNAYQNGGGMNNWAYGSHTSNAIIVNCLFIENSAGNGGAMINIAFDPGICSPQILNCTFYGNSSSTPGDAMVNSLSTPIVTNSILWGNGIEINNITDAIPDVTYSIVQGGYTGTGNLNADPLFVNAAGGDFSLTNASPAINAGDPSTNLSLFPGGPGNPEDLNGNPRVVGTDIDMGAYESQCANPINGGEIAAAQSICSGDTPAAFTSVSPASGNVGTLEYQWQSSITDASSGFADIADADAEGYQAGTLTQTTWFRRLARVDCMTDWTGAAKSNVVEITVEQTPVSGIFNKTPDVAIVCEGVDVSATLTAGSGGNGTDELEFRTNDGTDWSGWANYTSGNDISTSGLSEVEIRTRRTADYCSDAGYNTVSWTIEPTPVSGTLTKTPDLATICEGDDVSAALTAGSGGNGVDSLAYRTNDGSSWSAWLDYNSGDPIATLGKSEIEILTLRQADYCSDASAETVSWTVEPTPVSGTLTKNPDVASVAENSDVSATLSPGNGGNGTDSLAYRTNDGASWSAWANYSSGSIISTVGKTQVEILTLRQADICDDASAVTVSWSVGETPVAGTLTKNPNVDFVCEDSDVNATLTPGSGGNGVDSLVYRTHDGSAWSAWLDYNSGDLISTSGKTQIEILTLRQSDLSGDSAPNTVSWEVEQTSVSGTLTKTPDVATVCEGDDVSAILSAGSGGNGVDSLAYRTNDGSSWSAWMSYNSGNLISTSGKTEVEILTLRKADYCSDASAETVSWTVEPTPVSGTLAKTPDAANVCEGDDVSATLIAGSGGNGTDELEFRSHDGTNWTSWANYTSGNDISTSGLSEVEIRTRRTADYCSDAGYNTVNWQVEENPISGTLTKNPDVSFVCEGDDVSATLIAGSGGNGTDELEFRSHDGTNWTSWANYTSGNDISTSGLTEVEIRTRRTADYCSDAGYNTVNWQVEATPISGTLAKTPDAANVCEGTDVSATLTAGSGGNGTDELEYRSNDGTSWTSWANYTSGNDISTSGLTEVEIRTRRTADYCSDAGYNTVNWQVEENPISGTLTKTPDAANVCEGTDVSATLTAGNGGNGTDDLEFRTHDGTSWTGWANYSSGNDISTSGLTEVEIRTRRTADHCSDAGYNTVNWQVEATPISGTLAKTPDAANVCEGDNVAATLTAGNGGNGTDELEFRSHDGTNWTSWANYTSGNDISTSGLTEVEIRTRRTADYCSDAGYNTVNWQVEATPISGTLAKTPDAANVCEGTDVSATLTAGNGGNGTDELEFRTYDGTSWTSWANYTSGNDISTSGLTEVEIRTRRTADYCSDAGYNTVNWQVEENPISGTLTKNPDVSFVCEGDDVSATLTAGSGGNGTDELEYRSNDGTSWTSWANYTSGNNIFTTGLTEVEIRTRRTADYCSDAGYNTVNWQVEENPISGTLTKNPDVNFVCEGDDVSVTLAAGSGGNGVDSLAYRTNDGSSWSAWMDYTSGTPIATLGKSEVEILTLRKADYCSDASAETVNWTVDPTTVAGNISGDDATEYGSSTGDLTLAGYTGSVVKWQKRFGTSGGWTDISNTTDVFSETPSSAGTWQYRAFVQSGTCSEEITEPHSVLVGTKELTIGGSFTANDKIYDDNTDATFDQNNLELVSVVGSDDVSLTGLTIAFASKAVGNHMVSITNAELSGADKANYTLSQDGAPETTADINPGPPVKFLVTETDGTDISSPKLQNIPFDVKVTLVDAFDNPTPNTGGDAAVTLTGSGGAVAGDLSFVGAIGDPVELTLAEDESSIGFTDILYSGLSDAAGFDVMISAGATGTGSAMGNTGDSELFSVRGIFLTATADEATLPADGTSETLITVLLTDAQEPPQPLAGQQITLSTDFGTLFDITDPGNPMAIVGSQVFNTDANGEVKVSLQAAATSGVATVLALCPGACPAEAEVAFLLSAPVITGFSPGDESVEVDFDAPANESTDAITNYEYSLDDGATWAAFAPQQATSPVTVSGLTGGETYQLQLRAINGAGTGEASDSFEVYPCFNPTDGGEIAGDQLIEFNTIPAELTSIEAATGNFGTLEYLWQQSTTSAVADFSDIAGSDAADYQPGAITQNTWFRRLARAACKPDWSQAVVSNVIFIQTDFVQEVEIPAGWSYISSYIQPKDPAVANMFADITAANNLTILTGVNGIYAPAPFFINTLGNWDYTKGYKIKMVAQDELAVVGDTLTDKTLTFSAGTHIIPVLTDHSVVLADVIENPQAKVNYMLDLSGNKVFWPGGNIYTLTELEPGKGYLTNFGQSTTITYPDMTFSELKTKPFAAPLSGPWPIARTGNVHLISISAEAINQLENANYIGAFNSEGNCVGYAEISGATENILLTVYGDDLMTDENDGLEEGESISLQGFSYSSDKETPLQAEWNPAFASVDGLFAGEGLSQITAFKAGAIAGSESSDLAQVMVYPNPAKDVFTITPTGFKTLSGLAASLITADGRPVKTFTLSGEKTTVDISGLQPGVYLLRIAVDENVVVKRIVVQ